MVGGDGDESLGVGEVVIGVAGLIGGGVVGQENGDGVIAGREGVLAAAVGIVGGGDGGGDVGAGVGQCRGGGGDGHHGSPFVRGVADVSEGSPGGG